MLMRRYQVQQGHTRTSRNEHEDMTSVIVVIFSAVSQCISGLYWCSSLSCSLSPPYAFFFLLLICMLLLSVSNAGCQVNCCMAVCLCVADFGAGPAAWWRPVSVPPTVHVVWPSAEPVEAWRPEEGTCVYNFILTRLTRCRSGYAGLSSEVMATYSDQSMYESLLF